MVSRRQFLGAAGRAAGSFASQRTDQHRPLGRPHPPPLPEQEFFIRKAIGWVLRDYSYTDPEWVQAFVAAHEDKLSGLSKREALKQIRRQK